MLESKLEKHIIFSRPIYILRDDLLGDGINTANGNKARKFATLLSNKRDIVTYGGNQSNALATLSVIAKNNAIKLTYLTPKIPKYLASHIDGNLKIALENKANIIELGAGENIKVIQNKAKEMAKCINALYVAQGGDVALALEGMKELAKNLAEQIQAHGLKNVIIFYTLGSGSSVLALREALEGRFRLIGLDCVGEIYKRGMEDVLCLDIAFAKPDIRVLEMYHYLLTQTNIEFDLIYDCVGFLTLQKHLERYKDNDIIFIHSGGVLGNLTQKARYEYLGIRVK